MRAWRRLALIAALLAVHLALHGLWRLARRSSPWPRAFLGRAARAAGADVAIMGRPLARDALIVANHLSWFDILIVAGATGSRFVAMDEVRTWPAVGWLAGLNATVYIARTERGRAREQADRVRDALRSRAPVTLFPEGSTGDGIALGPFRASLLSALLPPLSGVRLQPIAIDYGEEAPTIAWGDTRSFGADAMRILALPGRRRIILHCLEPIDPALVPDRKAMSALARAGIGAALGETPRPAV